VPARLSEASARQLHITDHFTLIDDQNLGCQVHSHPLVQPAFAVSPAEISYQIVSRHKVGSKAGLNR
jgi:hypothetical protein